jgi:O-antigen/teichoic acid export membrane protein
MRAALQRSNARVRAHFSIRLFRTAYFLIISSGIMSVLGFPFWIIAARRYSTETIGISSTIISAMMLVSTISQLGLGQIITRYLPAAGIQTRRLIVGSYAAAAGASVLAAVIAAVTAVVWAPPIAFLGHDARWFALFVISVFAWTIFGLQDEVLVGLGQARWMPLENAVFALSKLVLVAAFAGIYPRAGVVVAWILPGILLVFPVNFAILASFVPRQLERHPGAARWRATDIRRVLAGNYLGTLVSSFGTLFLPILVTKELGVGETAFFFLPWTIALALCLVASGITTSLLVEVASAEASMRERTRQALGAILRVLVPVVALLVLLAPYVLRLLGSSYADRGTLLLRLLVLGTIPNAVAAVGLTITRIHHDGRLLARVQVVVAVVSITLSAVLLPVVGIEGAGVAWLVSQLLAVALLARPLRTAAVPVEAATGRGY